MPVTRLNHAVLFVGDLQRSVAFYADVLDFQPVNMTPDGFRGAAFLRASGSTNDHDLGLFEIGPVPADSGGLTVGSAPLRPLAARDAGPSLAGRATVGLYHLAWEVDTLAELERVAGRLAEAGALVGTSDHGTTKSLYGKDPDGLEFEVVWLIPADLLDEQALENRKRIRPLDLGREKQRYGADTRGGIGISIPA